MLEREVTDLTKPSTDMIMLRERKMTEICLWNTSGIRVIW